MKQKLFSLSQLVTNKIILRPLKQEDRNLLKELSNTPELWKYSVSPKPLSEGLFDSYFQKAIRKQQQQEELSLVSIRKSDNKICGMSRFYDINEKHNYILIGFTWIGVEFQKSGINRHNKYAMLKYAFEDLNVDRVQFNIDALNINSRKAVENIGGKLEGILRNHMKVVSLDEDQGFRRRDTCVYSILKCEWEQLKCGVFYGF